MSDAGSERSFHCGCPCDPYPDDPFQGHGPPDPDDEGAYLAKKADGVARRNLKKRHHGSKSTAEKSKKPGKTKAKRAIAEDLATKHDDTASLTPTTTYDASHNPVHASSTD